MNKKRKDKEYMENEVAIYLNGTAYNPELNKNPFLYIIGHRKGKDIYWNFNHMLL